MLNKEKYKKTLLIFSVAAMLLMTTSIVLSDEKKDESNISILLKYYYDEPCENDGIKFESDLVCGDLSNGYCLELNQRLAGNQEKENYYYRVTIDRITPEISTDDCPIPFYLDVSKDVPEGFYDYWEQKGVYEDCPGTWQPLMWDIINGDSPMFYISDENPDSSLNQGQEYYLIDGLIHDLGGEKDQIFRVNPDYPLGTYHFYGDITLVNEGKPITIHPDITLVQTDPETNIELEYDLLYEAIDPESGIVKPVVRIRSAMLCSDDCMGCNDCIIHYAVKPDQGPIGPGHEDGEVPDDYKGSELDWYMAPSPIPLRHDEGKIVKYYSVDSIGNIGPTYNFPGVKPIIDQENLNEGRGFPIRSAGDGDWTGAQTFVPTEETLTRMSIKIRKFGNPSFDLIVELREDNPTGTFIKSFTFSPAEISDEWHWLDINMEDIRLKPGKTYCIVVQQPPLDETSSFGYEWAYAFGNQYDDGSFWFTRDGGNLWRDLPTMYELAFCTFSGYQ